MTDVKSHKMFCANRFSFWLIFVNFPLLMNAVDTAAAIIHTRDDHRLGQPLGQARLGLIFFTLPWVGSDFCAKIRTRNDVSASSLFRRKVSCQNFTFFSLHY